MADTVRFFNFWNAQSYHVFCWLTESKNFDASAMIEQAFAEVKPDDLTLDSPCEAACKRLADDIQERVENAFSDLTDADSSCLSIGDVDCHINAYSNLLGPILANAIQEISFYAVAQALLVRADRWNPDTATPEFE